MENNQIKQFVDSGLLFLANQVLHCFGWVLVVVYDTDTKEYVSINVKKADIFGFKHEDVKHYIENFKNLNK